MSNGAIGEFLTDHPNLVSAVLTLMLLWSRIGSPVPSGGGHAGP